MLRSSRAFLSLNGRSFICFAGIFLISLQSYYFTPPGASLFPIAGVGLIAVSGLLSGRIPKDGKILAAAFFMLLFFSLQLTLDVFKAGSGLIKPLISGFVMVVLILTAPTSILKLAYWDKFVFALQSVVFVHLLAWSFQVVYFFTTGQFLDLLEPVTGEAQRVWSSKGASTIGVGRIPRFTGLFSEPGTYSTYIFVLAAMLRQATKGSTKLLFFCSATMILSFSLYGLILALGLLAVTINWQGLKGYFGFIFVTFSLAILYSIASFAIPFFRHRVDQGYGVDSRQVAIDRIISESNPIWGHANLDKIQFPVNDLTLPIALYGSGGMLLIASMLAVIVILQPVSLVSLFLIALVMVTKIKVAYPLLWLYFLVVYAANKNRIMIR